MRVGKAWRAQVPSRPVWGQNTMVRCENYPKEVLAAMADEARSRALRPVRDRLVLNSWPLPLNESSTRLSETIRTLSS